MYLYKGAYFSTYRDLSSPPLLVGVSLSIRACLCLRWTTSSSPLAVGMFLCIWACFSTYWGLLPPPSLPLLWVSLCMWACLSSNHDLPQSILYLWACLSTNHDLPQSILYLWACLCLCGHVSLLTMTSPNPSFTCGHVSVYVGMSLY